MPRNASFIYDFLGDFWDLLPKTDRELFAAYWHGLIMVVSDLYQESFEAALANALDDVQVWREERWNIFEFDSTNATLSSVTETITLTGTAPVVLANDAPLFSTLEVSNAAGQIQHSESLALSGETVYELDYDKLVDNSITVLLGTYHCVLGTDYEINKKEGHISRISTGAIPDKSTVTVLYSHEEYSITTDYTIDTSARTIARVATGNITSGDSVAVTYTRSTRVALTLSGTSGSVSGNNITDEDQDFTGVTKGRTITIASGSNAGTYIVESVLAANELQISTTFPAVEYPVAYSINAFPYAMDVDKKIRSIPFLQDKILEPTIIFREDVDYIVSGGTLSLRAEPPTTRTANGPGFWAEVTEKDEEVVYNNFGILLDFYRTSSATYLDAVKGIWYAYWMGSTHENLARGLHILIGLPYSEEGGTVSAIEQAETEDRVLTANADILPKPIRLVPGSPTDAINKIAKTITFTSVVGGDSFTSADIGKLIRVQRSSQGNNGYYTVKTISSFNTIEIETAESFAADETGGFTARMHEVTIDCFSYLHETFTTDDIGKILRISSSSSYNDGDYTIAAIISQSMVQISGTFAAKEGVGGFTAKLIKKIDSTISVKNADSLTTTYNVPTGLSAIVSEGDTVDKFERLIDGIRIIDNYTTKDHIAQNLGRTGIQKFLTQKASRGPGDSDETKALTMLKVHMWLPQILTNAVSSTISINEVRTFLDNLRPSGTYYSFAFADDFSDTQTFKEDLKPSDIELLLDLTTIFRNSWPNVAPAAQVQYVSTSGNLAYQVIRTPVTAVTISAPRFFFATDGAFTSADVGRYINVSGSSAGNDGEYKIATIVSSTAVIVASDFADNESPGFTAEITTLNRIIDGAATFTTTANMGDVVQVSSGQSIGHYKVLSVVDDTSLLVYESIYDGPFVAPESPIDFSIISHAWFMNQGAVTATDEFLFEHASGEVTGANTFEIPAGYDLNVLGAKKGMQLIITTTGDGNEGMYEVTAINSSVELSATPAFFGVAGAQAFGISCAALKVTGGVSDVFANI